MNLFCISVPFLHFHTENIDNTYNNNQVLCYKIILGVIYPLFSAKM